MHMQEEHVQVKKAKKHRRAKNVGTSMPVEYAQLNSVKKSRTEGLLSIKDILWTYKQAKSIKLPSSKEYTNRVP